MIRHGVSFHGTTRGWLEESLRKFGTYRQQKNLRMGTPFPFDSRSLPDVPLAYAFLNAFLYDDSGVVLVIDRNVVPQNRKFERSRGVFFYELEPSEFIPHNLLPVNLDWIEDYKPTNSLCRMADFFGIRPRMPDEIWKYSETELRKLESLAKGINPSFGGIGRRKNIEAYLYGNCENYSPRKGARGNYR